MHHIRRRPLINFRRKLQVDRFLDFPLLRHSAVGMACSMTTLESLFIKSSDGLSFSLKKTVSTWIHGNPRNETGSRGLVKWTFFSGFCREGLEELEEKLPLSKIDMVDARKHCFRSFSELIYMGRVL